MALAVLNPIPQFFDKDGDPLDNGYLYFGLANQNPVTSPQTVYWDADETIPAAQPIRTLNGYPVRSGTPAIVYVPNDFSLLVKNRRGQVVFYAANSADFGNAATLRAEIAALRADLASSVSATKGAGQIGFGPTLNYVANTLGAAVQDGLVNVMWFLNAAERAQVKANGTALDLTPAFNAARSWAGARPLYAPAGTWSVTSIDFRGYTSGLIGDGIGNTILKVRSAAANVLNFLDTADANPRTFTLKGFSIDGNSLATVGIDMRYRHQGSIEDVFVSGCPGAGIKQLDTYCCNMTNVRCNGNGVGLWLVGSNHASVHTMCSFDTNTIGNLLIQKNGTPNDGNDSLVFIGCVTQSAPAGAYGVDFDGTSATFTGCYFGENNVDRAAIIMRGGTAVFDGGTLFIGFSGTSYGITPLGGFAQFRGLRINGQGGNLTSLSGGGTGGKFFLEDCQTNVPTGGDQYVVGDVLDYGPPSLVYTDRLGKNWTGQANNVTFSSVVSGSKQTFTVLTAPGPTPLLGARANLTNATTWRDGEPLYCVVVYESSRPIGVRTSAGAFGAPVLTFASTLPATSGGVPHTAFLFNTNAAAAGGSIVEINQQTSGVGDTLVIHEVFLADARMLNRVVGNVGNLWKC